ncbi:MAG: hypothetical protein KDC80_29115 [Saprospiraceae bacterium]|nr:hypothetical protein [Saprospiraceae bacterium]
MMSDCSNFDIIRENPAMKMLRYPSLHLLIAAFLMMSCGSSHTLSRDKKKIIALQTVAILPVEVVHLGRLHEVANKSESQQLGIEREGYILQRDLYRYFLRDMKKYELKRTYLQDLKITNDRLKELEETVEDKVGLSVREIADWLGVDGIISTSVDQLAPGNVLAAGFMNGTLNTDQSVSITLSLRSKYGQIYWRHEDDRPTPQEDVYQISKDLLKHASKSFFSVYPSVKSKKRKKDKKNRKQEVQIRSDQ